MDQQSRAGREPRGRCLLNPAKPRDEMETAPRWTNFDQASPMQRIMTMQVTRTFNWSSKSSMFSLRLIVATPVVTSFMILLLGSSVRAATCGERFSSLTAQHVVQATVTITQSNGTVSYARFPNLVFSPATAPVVGAHSQRVWVAPRMLSYSTIVTRPNLFR